MPATVPQNASRHRRGCPALREITHVSPRAAIARDDFYIQPMNTWLACAMLALSVSAGGCTLGRTCDDAFDRTERSDIVDGVEHAPEDDVDIVSSCWHPSPDLKLGPL
jgi:hypothetical protein